MNIPGNNVPIIGHKEPFVLQTQTIITPELKSKLDAWQAETGIHMWTLGNIIYTLGVAQLSKLLDNDRQALDEEVERIETEPEAGSSQDS